MKIATLLLSFLLLSGCGIFEEKYTCTSEGRAVSVKIKGNVMTFEVADFNFCESAGNKNFYSQKCKPANPEETMLVFDTISKELEWHAKDLNNYYSCSPSK
jgi:hypothetical protein